MEVLDQVLAFLNTIGPATIATIAVVLEFALRLIPSKKPRSILLLVGKVAGVLGAIFTKVADILSKTVPQIEEDKPKD